MSNEDNIYAIILIEYISKGKTESWLTSYFGSLDMDLLNELHNQLRINQNFYTEELEALSFISGQYSQLLVELIHVKEEKQFGSGEGEVYRIPAYYMIVPIKLIQSKQEVIRYMESEDK